MVVNSYIDKKCENSDYLLVIDKALAQKANSQLDEIRFKIKSCVDAEQTAILSDLRKILEDKLRGSDCYEKYSLDSILNIIKKQVR